MHRVCVRCSRRIRSNNFVEVRSSMGPIYYGKDCYEVVLQRVRMRKNAFKNPKQYPSSYDPRVIYYSTLEGEEICQHRDPCSTCRFNSDLKRLYSSCPLEVCLGLECPDAPASRKGTKGFDQDEKEFNLLDTLRKERGKDNEE